MIEFEYVINGEDCIVYADNFTEDLSVGINFGPDDLWAVSVDGGTDIEIGNDLIEKLTELSIEIFMGNLEDLEF